MDELDYLHDENRDLHRRIHLAAEAVRHLHPDTAVSEHDRQWWDQLSAAVLTVSHPPRYGNLLDDGGIRWAGGFAEAERIQNELGLPMFMEPSGARA
ncbi:hypothetical protein [Pseudoclavibacter soli]|uniref:hypothetical protein n=1 Tax=Pseudoclavibacter soli TaxID=452623 RepID=UPI0003FB45D0|nr:hypothetical protein [Pseudoclavibacter soli]